MNRNISMTSDECMASGNSKYDGMMINMLVILVVASDVIYLVIIITTCEGC